jgi:AraC-like DNA-binding protein
VQGFLESQHFHPSFSSKAVRCCIIRSQSRRSSSSSCWDCCCITSTTIPQRWHGRGPRSHRATSNARSIFIEGNIAAPIGVADIVAVSAVSGRALFKHFRRFTGLSPLQYVRETRLRHVREALLNAQPEEHIATVAARWGFNHPGRFASDYRRRFGETPSDSRRRGKAGSDSGASRDHVEQKRDALAARDQTLSPALPPLYFEPQN